jgi:hypothetical protein
MNNIDKQEHYTKKLKYNYEPKYKFLNKTLKMKLQSYYLT